MLPNSLLTKYTECLTWSKLKMNLMQYSTIYCSMEKAVTKLNNILRITCHF